MLDTVEPNECCLNHCDKLNLSNKVLGVFQKETSCATCRSRLQITYTVHPGVENQIEITDIYVLRMRTVG